MKTTQVIISVAAAAAAGVAIGMLIAPEKGEELQKKISAGARTWLGELVALIGTVKTTAEEQREAVESRVQKEVEGMNSERA